MGFRHRARLAVRGRVKTPKIGIFEAGTHRVVHIPSCVIHHPLVNDVAAVVRRSLVDLGVPPYSDAAHLGCVRAVQVVVERPTQSAQVVVVTRDTEPVGLDALFAAIRERLGPRLHSLWWNGNPERTNTILGPHFVKIAGPDSAVELQDGVRIHYPPGAFGQSNLPLFDEVARRVRDSVPDGARVLELYAGTGVIGLPLASRVARLAMNEISDGSLDGLRLGVAELPSERRERVAIHPGPAASVTHLIPEADVVIVDPPRKGLEPDVLAALVRSPPARLVYVSCGLPSFLTDAEHLIESGAWMLRSLDVFALFPFTEHVETLAVFDRR